MSKKVVTSMNLRKVYKNIKSFFRKYINGAKGAVSLLLVLVMSPLLSISLLLVESARYQDAMQLMEEVINSSAFSTLAGYDSYLDERFGLLSIAQDTNVSAVFSEYLDYNVSALGESVDIDSKTITGKYPLSNTGILKQQILECGEISVASKIVIDGIDLEDLLDKLKEALGLDKIEKEIEAVNASVELGTEIEKLIEGIDDAKKQYNKYASELANYKAKYSEFETKGVALVNALNSAANELEEGESYDSIYDKQSVKNAISDLKSARNNYKNATSNLKTEYEKLKKEIETIMSAIDSLPSKLQSFNDAVAGESLLNECTTSTGEWLLIVADQATTTFNSTIGNDFKDKSAAEITALGNQIIKLGNLGDKTITSGWNSETIKSEYGVITTSVSTSFSTKMTNLITLLDSKASVDDESKNQMTDLLNIVNELLGISGLYDANLDAVVATSSLYTNTSMSISAQLSVASLTDLIWAGEDFVDGITSLNIIKAIKAVVKLLKSIAEFFASIVAWAAETLVNLITYISQGTKEWYNGLILYGYGAYNTPNRTNYKKKGIFGYSYHNIYKMAGGLEQESTLTGSLKTLSSFGSDDGTSKMFKGAETEYLLVGSNSEFQNQSVAFFDLYLLRLLLDIAPILKNNEVNVISAAAGPGAWIVKLAIILAEPLLDTIVLVNGGKEYFIKETVYFSYSGFVILQEDLAGITAISDNLKAKIKDTIKAHNGKPKEKGWCNGSYTEHMLILLLLSVSQQTYLQRLQNLIQTETAVKHKDMFTFQLDKTYTYLYSDVKYTLKPMFNIDSLTEDGNFTINCKQYCGY